jgi:DNA-binding beta-propeller fold protein YncE
MPRTALFLVTVLLSAVLAATPAWSYVVIVPDAGSGSDTIATFDTATNLPGPSVSSGASVAMLGAAFSPDGRTGYAVAAGSNSLVPIDVSGASPVAGMPVPLTGSPGVADLTYMAVSPDGRKAYISDGANGGNSKVMVVDLTGVTPVVTTEFAVAANPHGIAFTPDGSKAYVASFSGAVTPVTVATNTPGPPITGVGTHPDQIAITPDGQTAYVTDNGSSNVYPIALPAQTVGAPIIVDDKPVGIAITPDGRKAYVANNGAESSSPGSGSTVTPITLATGTPGPAIAVAPGPWAIAITPDGRTAYAASSGSVTPIDTTTDTPDPPISTGVAGRSIAITPDQAPVASFTVVNDSTGSATFDASGSTVRFGTIASYVWDFGDGTAPVTTLSPTISHNYAANGTYSAKVTETDSAGTSTTGEVYTGQTASRVGNASASTTRSVVITTAPAPAVTLSATGLGFGGIGVGRTSDAQTLTLKNNGNGPLAIAGSAIGGPQAGEFSLAADTCSGHTVAAGAACTAAVSFHPSAGGAAAAQLAFTDNATGSPHTVALTGEGQTTVTIAGTVRDGSKSTLSGVAGAGVSICTYSTRAVCRSTATGASGTYSVAGLPKGTYQIEVLPATSSLFGGSAVVQAGIGTTTADFRLDAPQSFPSGVTFNGQSGGTGSSYWTSPSVLQVPVSVPTGRPAGSSGKTVVNFWVDPQGGSPVGGTSGQLAVVYRYDGAGLPRLVSLTAKTSATTKAGSPAVGAWTTSTASALAVGADVSSFTAQGQLTPPANGPYFHGAQTFLVNYFSTFSSAAASMSGAAAPPPGPCDPPVSRSPDGKVTLPGGSTWDPKSLTVHRADGSEMFVFSPTAPPPTGPDGQQIAGLAPDGTPIPLSETPVNGNPDVIDTGADSQINISPTGNPNDEVWVDTSPGPSSGRYGFSPDGSFTDLNTGIKYGPDGNPDGRTNQGRPDNPCPPGQPFPPPTPTKPPGGSGTGGTTGSNYVDPSGSVTTSTHVPVAGAKVVLMRAANAKGPFRAVKNGSTVMSPGNRRNLDRTTALGLFAWDVLPGFYRVTAQHSGCAAVVKTRALTIPPAVLGLELVLKCPHLRRAATRTKLQARKVAAAQVVLAARVRGRHPSGIVRFYSGHRHLGDVPVDPRTGRATMTAAGRGTKGMSARYQGDGLNAPSRG